MPKSMEEYEALTDEDKYEVQCHLYGITDPKMPPLPKKKKSKRPVFIWSEVWNKSTPKEREAALEDLNKKLIGLFEQESAKLELATVVVANPSEKLGDDMRCKSDRSNGDLEKTTTATETNDLPKNMFASNN